MITQLEHLVQFAVHSSLFSALNVKNTNMYSVFSIEIDEIWQVVDASRVAYVLFIGPLFCCFHLRPYICAALWHRKYVHQFREHKRVSYTQTDIIDLHSCIV